MSALNIIVGGWLVLNAVVVVALTHGGRDADGNLEW